MAYRSTYVHISVGYPGVKFLPDLQEYRNTYDDYVRVVNAYEPHEHVYEELKRRPGLVMVRGGGITSPTARFKRQSRKPPDVHGSTSG